MRQAPAGTVAPSVILEADERNLVGTDAADLAAANLAGDFFGGAA